MKTFHVVGIILSLGLGLSYSTFAKPNDSISPDFVAPLDAPGSNEGQVIPNGLASVEDHGAIYPVAPLGYYRPAYGYGYGYGAKLSDLPKAIEPLTAEQLAERWSSATKENEATYRRGQWPLKPMEPMQPAALGVECVQRKEGKLGEKFPALIHAAMYPGFAKGGLALISHEKDQVEGKPMPSDFFRKRNWKQNLLQAEMMEQQMKLGQLSAALAGIQAQIKPPAELWDRRVMELNKKILSNTAELDGIFELGDNEDKTLKRIGVLEAENAILEKKKAALLEASDPTESTGLDALKKKMTETQDRLEALRKELLDNQDIEMEENRGLFTEIKRDSSGLPRYRLRPGLKLLEYGLEANIENPLSRVYASADNQTRVDVQFVKDPNNKTPNSRQTIYRFTEPDQSEIFCY